MINTPCEHKARQGARMRAEFTAKIKKQGNSAWVLIPNNQLDIVGVKIGDIVKVTVEKPKE